MHRHLFASLSISLAIISAAVPAAAANKLHVLKPTQGQVFYNGSQILVQARPGPGIKLPVLSVKWEITCTSCGNPPTSASVFTQPDLTNPQPGYDVTNVLGPGKYCARVELYPEQPGWDWSDQSCFTWVNGSGPIRLPKVPVLQTPPYPKNPDPGPIRPQTNPATQGTH
jgi:hypothetical protein